MHRTILMAGILGVSLMMLSGCQSMTGKTAGQTMDDSTITSWVSGKLTHAKLSNFSHIDVETERGVVTLNGVVKSMDEKTRAGDIAAQVAGVTKVNNNLQIQSISMSNP